MSRGGTMLNFIKGTLAGTFGFAMYGLYGSLVAGGLYWLWMAARMGSVVMFIVGLVPPAYVVTAPVGLYSMIFGKPHWVVSWFGDTGKGAWPEGAKQAYVDQCAPSMNSRGLSMEKAKGGCRCISDGLEAEFGLRDYNAMLKAQPNPEGSDADQRLYRVVDGCMKWLH
jgi:hypothetical protein